MISKLVRIGAIVGGPTVIRVCLVLTALALAASCSSTQPETQTKASGIKVSPDGGLRMTVQKTVVDGQKLRIKGVLVNRFDQRVEGVRYTVQMIIPGSTPKVVDTARTEADTALDPGTSETVKLEIDKPIYAATPAMFDIAVTPIRLGGAAIPAAGGS